ncbi:MAG: DUF5666 domain-containing protein [Anaerolineales bacterium]
MKKFSVILLVLVLALALVAPAAAAGNGPGSGGSGNGNGQQGPRGTFAITGTITAIGPNTVTVQVYRGNTLVQPYLGTPVTVTVTAGTRYLFKSSSAATATAITFADLRVGNPVSVNGTLANNVWTASRITVGASLSCLP